MKLNVMVVVIITVLLSGCLEIPLQETLLTNHGERQIIVCPPAIPVAKQPGSGFKSTFRLTVWNLHKFQRANWQNELKLWSARSDLLLLQEVMGRPAFTRQLQQFNFNWMQEQAFRLEGETTGVLDATTAESLYTCSIRTPEPVSRLPKSVLFALYSLEGSRNPLLIVNVHGINFEPGMAAYSRQMTKIFQLAARYPGPVIVAGDFASWGHRRMGYLAQLAQQSGFSEVLPSPDLRVRVISEAVDHIFYRQLVLRRSDNKQTNTSDHNPLWAEFSVLSR